jgi:hypothetical protein
LLFLLLLAFLLIFLSFLHLISCVYIVWDPPRVIGIYYNFSKGLNFSPLLYYAWHNCDCTFSRGTTNKKKKLLFSSNKKKNLYDRQTAGRTGQEVSQDQKHERQMCPLICGR